MFYAELFLIHLILIWYQIFMVAEKGQMKNIFSSLVRSKIPNNFVRIYLLYHIIFLYIYSSF